MKFDITRYCSTQIKAGISLEKILNEEYNDEKLNRYVGKILNNFINYFNSISEIKNIKHWQFVSQIMYEEIKKQVVKRNYPENVETHLLNVVSAMYRTRLKNGKNERKQKRVR